MEKNCNNNNSNSINENNNNFDNTTNNNNNFIENYDFFTAPITKDNEYIINQLLSRNINDLINDEINKFLSLKKRIREIIPKKNNLIQLLISDGEELPDDPSRINFIYRVIISKKESNGIFHDNYSKMKLILNNLKGIIGIFQEVDNDEEIILGFADVGNNSCEFVLLATCLWIQYCYDKVEDFDKKNYEKPQIKGEKPHRIKQTQQTYDKEDYKNNEEYKNLVFRIKLLIQEEKALFLKGVDNDQANRIANASGIKLKIFNTRFPDSNEYLLMAEGIYGNLEKFFYYTSSIFRKEERVKLMNYIPTSKYYLDFKKLQENF